MNIEFKKYSENYPNDILRSIWEESFHNIDCLRRIEWAYKGNVCGMARLWVIKDGTSGDEIGCSALLPRFFCIKGEKRNGALIADTAIKKSFRALGPALLLHEEIVRNLNAFVLILAFPNKIAEALIKRVGFRKAKNFVHYIKIIKSKIVIEKKIKSPFLAKLLLLFTPMIDLGLRITDRRVGLNKTYSFDHVEEFSDKFDEICDKFKNRFDFTVDRNSYYLNWRYRKCPFKNYKIYTVIDKHKLNPLAYVIYYEKESRIFVDDFLWLEESLKLEHLLYLFTRAMHKRGVQSISFRLMENLSIQKSFSKMRFFKINSGSSIYYFTPNLLLKESIPKSLENAFVTSGDRD